MQSCVVRNSSRLFERSRLIRRNIPRRGVCVFGVGVCVCVRRRVCVFGGGRWCVSLARACAAHDRRPTRRARSTDARQPTRAPDRRRPPTPIPRRCAGSIHSYSTRASHRVRAINLFYVPLCTQTSYCARIRPSRVARDGVRADDRGRGHARDATRSLLVTRTTYRTGCSLEYSVVWTLIRAIGRGRRAAIHVSGGRRRRAGARAVT